MMSRVVNVVGQLDVQGLGVMVVVRAKDVTAYLDDLITEESFGFSIFQLDISANGGCRYYRYQPLGL